MKDLRNSYPLEDMRSSLTNLPPDIDFDYIDNCARSVSSSEVSSVQSKNTKYNRHSSHSSTNSLDILVVDQNEID